MGCHEVDRLDDVVEDGLRDEVVERDSVQPGLMPSQPRLTTCLYSSDRSRPMPSKRWPYGPAHEQPPRDWIPNRSLSKATTKLWWRNRPEGPWTMNETIESLSASRLPRIRMFGFFVQRSTARRQKSSSCALITSTPTASLSWKTSPARIASTMAGVPPSSRVTGSSR